MTLTIDINGETAQYILLFYALQMFISCLFMMAENINVFHTKKEFLRHTLIPGYFLYKGYLFFIKILIENYKKLK